MSIHRKGNEKEAQCPSCPHEPARHPNQHPAPKNMPHSPPGNEQASMPKHSPRKGGY